jgi:hypothetical protein
LNSPPGAPFRARAALVLSAAILALGVTAIPAKAACGVPRISLSGFSLGNQVPHFYRGPEGGPATIGALATEFCPNQEPFEGSTKWQLSAGTAGLDETNPDSDTFTFQASGPHETVPDDDVVELSSTGGPEAVTENVTLTLTSPTQGNVVAPTQAPLYIIDTDGANRVATAPASSTPTLSEGQVFKFPVFKAGPGEADVAVTVTGGSASDYQQPAPVHFLATDRFKIVTINILEDDSDTGAETYTATIASGGAAAVSTPTAMSFVVNDIQSDNDAPLTSFHHPKNGVTYKFGSAKARTVHVYAPGAAEEPSGIVDSSVKTAVKRTMKSGSCKWWSGSAWVNDGCADSNRNDHWLKTEFLYPFNGKRLYEHYLKQDLPPSVGTPTKFFHVYSTAKDGAGNWDDQVELGRNKNKFEIEKS